MIIIGEKINGAIPSIKQAIAERNEALIVERTLAQAKAGANFLDCAPSTATEIEYETMVWLIGLMQGCTDVPLCIDSPNAALLARILDGIIDIPMAAFTDKLRSRFGRRRPSLVIGLIPLILSYLLFLLIHRSRGPPSPLGKAQCVTSADFSM